LLQTHLKNKNWVGLSQYSL